MQFQKFIDAHPPLGNWQKADASLLEKYQGLVPEGLLEIWREYGFGFCSDGFLQMINPDSYHEVLCNWLMRESDFTRIPIMITAFGTIIYYRMLMKDEEGKIIADDVAYIEPNYSQTDTCAWSLNDFFDKYLCDKINLNELFFYDFFPLAKENYGSLANDEIYFFVPALRLGGNEDINNMDKGHAVVHLDFLLQLVLE
jgi:hypothetical protein